MTQKELAACLYVSDKAVSKWERGLSVPDISLLVPLAEQLNVTVAELLHRLPRGGGAALYPRGNRGTDPQGTRLFRHEPPELTARPARRQFICRCMVVSVVLGLVRDRSCLGRWGWPGSEGAY